MLQIEAVYIFIVVVQSSVSRPIITFTVIVIIYLYSHDGSCGSVLGPEINTGKYELLEIVTKIGFQCNFKVTVQNKVTLLHVTHM